LGEDVDALVALQRQALAGVRSALGGIEQAEGSSQPKLQARGREGDLGEDTDALAALQRQALVAGLLAEGAAGWDALLALSPIKGRFIGRDSMKVDREEEDMIAVM
jgi:hypothetical protein